MAGEAGAPPGDEIERGRPGHRELARPPGHPTLAAPLDPRGLRATPSPTTMVAAPQIRERASRVTIGRIDVEVHNEAPPAPSPSTASRGEPSGLAARLASRFLLKP
jgi:hypothetical protein